MTDQPSTNHRDHDPTTDQPVDHGGMVGDQPPTDLNQPAGQQEETPALISLEEAAAALGTTVNAVRQRIKRGTVGAIRTEAGWLVDMVATNQRPGTSRPPTTATNQPANPVVDPTDQQPITDLAPLAEVIREQHREIAEQANRIAELSAAAAMWQTRALHLQEEVEQLQQLTATAESAGEAPDATESDETDDHTRTPGQRYLAAGAHGGAPAAVDDRRPLARHTKPATAPRDRRWTHERPAEGVRSARGGEVTSAETRPSCTDIHAHHRTAMDAETRRAESVPPRIRHEKRSRQERVLDRFSGWE